MSSQAKVVRLTDIDTYLVTLPHGSYTINGERLDIPTFKEETVQVHNLDDIKRVDFTRVITHYVNVADENITQDPVTYDRTIAKMQSKGVYEDGVLEFPVLEDEFEYKIFKRNWVAVFKKVMVESSPLDYQIITNVYDTGSPYMKPLFNDEVQSRRSMVEFDRQKFQMDTFKELLVEYDLKSVVHIPTHGHLRFVKLFDAYAFSDEWSTTDRKPAMTLEDAKKAAQTDKDKLTEIVRMRVNTHRGQINTANFPFATLLTSVNSIECSLKNVEPYSKTRSSYLNALKEVRGLRDLITKALAQ